MRKNRLRIAVVFGGPSPEHEVSIKSGRNVFKNLDIKKYDIVPVYITKDEQWLFHEVAEQPLSTEQAIAKLQTAVDIVLLVMHGAYGEDGTIQKYLEDAGIPFTGSGSDASRLAMDKLASSEVYIEHGLTVPKQLLITQNDNLEEQSRIIATSFTLPRIVKPNTGGSTIGMTRVTDESQTLPALTEALRYSPSVLVQELIQGMELTCGVLDEGTPETTYGLPPTEIIPPDSGFFDYHAKYTPGASQEITPARLPDATLAMIQSAAVKAHQVLGCSGLSRSDFILDATGKLYILETNTIPGMTQTSLLPQAAAAAGMSFSELLDAIIQAGMARHIQKTTQ